MLARHNAHHWCAAGVSLLDLALRVTTQIVLSLSIDTPLLLLALIASENRASALGMTRVLQATQAYLLIAHITSQRSHAVRINGQPWTVRNTNGLVGQAGWNLLASKTGFTNEAVRRAPLGLT